MGGRFVVCTVRHPRAAEFPWLSQRLGLEVQREPASTKSQLGHEIEAHPSAPQSWVGEVAQPEGFARASWLTGLGRLGSEHKPWRRASERGYLRVLALSVNELSAWKPPS